MIRTLLLGILTHGILTVALPAEEIPLADWTVPPYRRAEPASGITTMTDLTPGIPFVGTTPCRLVDTRQAGFPAGYGSPILSQGTARNFDLNSNPNCQGIPDDVEAYSLNITVTGTQGPGFLKIWPQGTSEPNVSTINYVANQTIANAAIVLAGTNGGVRVIAGVSGTHVIIDINGYFTSILNTGTTGLDIVCDNLWGAYVVNQRAGGKAFGVIGESNSQGNSAGVLGATFPYLFPSGSWNGAGVRGEGILSGVLGIAGNYSGGGEGVAGSLVNSSGVEVAYGALGGNFGTDVAGPPWGVFAGGNIGATGTKHFLEPHPRDPKLSIAYVSLEGPEAGTYFRGRGKIQNGLARITVPEHFRLVTDPEGLTVQITAIGAMATFAVTKMDLDEIVVQASRNVEFSYLVQGVRASFKELVPLRESADFMPRRADAKMPLWLAPAQQRALIQNGTYRQDGTINMETARRLGWDKIWEQRSRPAPQPTEP